MCVQGLDSPIRMLYVCKLVSSIDITNSPHAYLIHPSMKLCLALLHVPAWTDGVPQSHSNKETGLVIWLEKNEAANVPTDDDGGCFLLYQIRWSASEQCLTYEQRRRRND